jgi:hypothetical protein
MNTSISEPESRSANRLIHETSPYLHQHAYNPVDWYPWGREAIDRAKELNRPIFLSIGYSACHWCHVMEHESFENDEIAAVMNSHFINIKVDREERPDLDSIYMNAVQLLTGRGGWPMSVFLTPDLKPFYGGTYWPPVSRPRMPGFKDILLNIQKIWESNREAAIKTAGELTSAIESIAIPQLENSELTDELLRQSNSSIIDATDRVNGGIGSPPKFPHPMNLQVLLRCWKRFGNSESLQMANLTLQKMAHGGIYDHLGCGFHRYSTDESWLVPHFEKMLYDNALLATTYLDAFQATGQDVYAQTVHETLDYTLNEMTQPAGGFYSTQDADSEGVEGKFFVWSETEIDSLLDETELAAFKFCFDVTPQGNWEGNTILNRVHSNDEAATQFNIRSDQVAKQIGSAKQKLLETRSQRIAPGRDDKILVSWNGLMISAMAKAASIFEEEKYAQAARSAVEFIRNNMRSETGELFHVYKDGQAKVSAFLDDYACLINGLVELYQATWQADLLEFALELTDDLLERFYDSEQGGFFYTPPGQSDLIVRGKDSRDSATPSGNAMAAYAIIRLSRMCGRTDLDSIAVKTLESLSGQLSQMPLASGQAFLALDFHLGPAYEIVIIDGDQPTETEAVLKKLRRHFLPNAVFLRRANDMSDDQLPPALKTILQGKTSRDGQPTIYCCELGTCSEPVVGLEGVQALMERIS